MKNIDQLAQELAFEKDKEKIFQEIKTKAVNAGIFPTSTFPLYQQIAYGKISGFTVPAINIKTLTYDIARIIFQIIKKYQIGPLIFELARSEMSYTNQTPKEYAGLILASAIKENYQGPIFFQGDHYQINSVIFQKSPQQEIETLKILIKESIDAGFYNIDIDASTLVDLTKPTLDEQQKENYQITALLTKYIREIEPKNITVTIGGEIGHIGGKNSTVSEFETFIEGYIKEIKNQKSKIKIEGISKVSVQTGTAHGGTPLPNGKLADVKLDFNVIKKIGEVARKKYHLGGVVQHGASTLPEELFSLFPKVKTLEIHLGTEFLNIVFDHLPKNLKEEIYLWIKNSLKNEWQKGLTEKQFIYKTRKKSLGYFKKRFWLIPQEEKKIILKTIEEKIKKIFQKLNIFHTKPLTKIV